MTIHGTIRYVAPSTVKRGIFTVIVRDEDNCTRWVLWTRHDSLARICERKNQTPRPALSILFDAESKQLEAVGLPVSETHA